MTNDDLNSHKEHTLPYIPASWKFTKIEISPNDDPSAPPGRTRVPVPPAISDRILELRLAGRTFAEIQSAVQDEFREHVPLSTLHKHWCDVLWPQTEEGRQVAAYQRRFGLSAKFWRRYLSRDQHRRAASSTPPVAASDGVGAAIPKDSQSVPFRNPQ